MQLKWITEQRKPTELTAYEYNPRFLTPDQKQQIADSLERFGLVEIPAIDTNNRIIAGHQRIKLLIEVGKGDELIDVRVPNRPLTEEEYREYLIRSNANTGSWDVDTLADNFTVGELSEWGLDAEKLKGFTDSLPISENDIEEITTPAIPLVKLGDLFQLGPHRLLCADSKQQRSFEVLLGDEKAQMVFIDPPYNVEIDVIVNKGKTKHREFVEASGEMSSEQFIEFLSTIFKRMQEYSVDGSIHYICMDWEHGYEIITALRSTYGKGHRKTKEWFKNRCTWVKDNAGMGTFYRSQTEDIYVVKNGKKKHINNFELGQYGRCRTNVWQYAGANSFTNRPRNENNKTVSVGDLAYHPTPKSKEMVADAIRDCSNPKGIILDAFGGSGTTLIAAEMTDRRGYLIEVDPVYTQTIIKRYAKIMEGKKWTFKHLNGNLTIDELCNLST